MSAGTRGGRQAKWWPFRLPAQIPTPSISRATVTNTQHLRKMSLFFSLLPTDLQIDILCVWLDAPDCGRSLLKVLVALDIAGSQSDRLSLQFLMGQLPALETKILQLRFSLQRWRGSCRESAQSSNPALAVAGQQESCCEDTYAGWQQSGRVGRQWAQFDSAIH